MEKYSSNPSDEGNAFKKDLDSALRNDGRLTADEAKRILHDHPYAIERAEIIRYTIRSLQLLKSQIQSEWWLAIRTNAEVTWANKEDIVRYVSSVANGADGHAQSFAPIEARAKPIQNAGAGLWPTSKAVPVPERATASQHASAYESAVPSQRPGVPETRDEIGRKNLVIGDSLSVGIGIKSPVGAPVEMIESGTTTNTMLRKFQNVMEHAHPGQKRVFVLGGTNDVVNGLSSGHTIGNIEQMRRIAEKNGMSFVAGTVPPMGAFLDKHPNIDRTKVQKNIEEINAFVRSLPNHVDYASMLTDPSRPGYLHSAYVSGDGLHMNGKGYALMRQALVEKAGSLAG